MPPVPRPIPRFIADAPREGLPYGRFAQILGGKFMETCAALPELPADAVPPAELVWFPERTWGGRTFVPVTGREPAGERERSALEYYGTVSFERLTDGSPHAYDAWADFTDVTADENPDWQIDLSDHELGPWHGPGEVQGTVTLVWGTPLVPGAVAATAELDGEVVDQAEVTDERFSIVAVDAITGSGPELYLEIRLHDRRGELLAADSLYAADEEE